MNRKPLYVTYPALTHNSYAVAFEATENSTASAYGYGPIPEQYRHLPVIDFRPPATIEAVCAACNLPDSERPREENPRYGSDLYTYLELLENLGIPVTRPCPLDLDISCTDCEYCDPGAGPDHCQYTPQEEVRP